jgi:hypothetical protein
MEHLKLKILDFFKELRFEEGNHIYTVNGKNPPSVSKMLKKYYKPFNSKVISEASGKKHGISPAKLRRQWKKTADDACDRGHVAHKFGENYAIDRSIKPSTPLEEAIVKFWAELPEHIVPVILEAQMYHKVFMFCGTADILLYDTINKCFIIADYKTNGDLFKNFAGKKMTKQFSNMLDSPFGHYQVQLSFYQILIEQLGIKVSRRIIVYLQDDATYTMYDTDDHTESLLKDLRK